MKKESDILEHRRDKIRQLRADGLEPFPNDFTVTHTIGQINALTEDAAQDITEERPVFACAGRIMAMNKFGKAAFIRFRDRSGQLQAYIKKDMVGDAAYKLFKKLDIGDFVGLTGSMSQTRTEEWTLLARQVQLVSKATRPLPEKFHGLKDPEKRYRKRYVDLIMNPDVRRIFATRSRIIQEIRNFLLEKDFLEVETPMMQPIAGGAEATPFVTHHNVLDMDLYLRIAPELYLKRLVVGGFQRVFEINRNFRNEGVSTRHNPEFTMLEFYQAYATYKDLMTLTEKMFKTVTAQATGSSTISYQGETIEMGGTWARMTLAEALEKLGGLDPQLLNDRDGLLGFAREKGIKLSKTGRLGKIITKLFDVTGIVAVLPDRHQSPIGCRHESAGSCCCVRSAAMEQEAQYPCHLGRRYRSVKYQRFHNGVDGLSDTQHRSDRQRGHDIHGLLC